jgi:hypothetical protein
VLRLDGALDGVERVDGKNPKRCQATAVQETRIRNLTRRREGAEEKEERGKRLTRRREGAKERKKDGKLSHAETRRRERVGIECRSNPRRFVAVRVSWSAPA